MREIKFRALGRDSGDWYYGSFVADNDKEEPHIIEASGATAYIRVETVGQYTGLKDKNGVKIFEGDVCKAWENVGGVYDERIVVIEWYDCGLVGALGDFAHYTPNPSWEIIGNIYSNPELLPNGKDGDASS